MNAVDVWHLRRAAAGYAMLAAQTADPVTRHELTRASIIAAEAARQGDADTVAGGVIGSVVGRLGGLL